MSVVNPLADDAWLGTGAEPQVYWAIIEYTASSDDLEVFPVSKAVNSPKNDSPELVRCISSSGE